MRRFERLVAKRYTQIVLFIVGIFCVSLLAIQPFTLNQMPETADGLLHLYRTVAVDYSLKVDNPLWMRYSTGIVYGYGAPLFNYFPPLSYYFGSWIHTLGLSFVQSWLAMMIVYTMTSAVGMFFLGRIWTQSNVGGWVSAIAYIYAPYFLFDSVARGTSSELGALAILPFVFYGFTRLAFYGRRIDFLLTVIAFALFIPMHTIITLHGTAILGVYCLFLWWNVSERRQTFLRLLFAGGLALLVTTFFWLPAIMETDAVKINLIAENLEQIDVMRHLRPLAEVITLPHTADPTQMAQPIPITLSVVQLIISAFGLVIAWNDRNTLFRKIFLLLWGLLLLLLFMNTPASVWLWENVPLIGYTQFPWRLLGVASLILALMTGISIWLSWAIIPTGWIKSAVFSVLTLLVMTTSIPWTYSLYLDNVNPQDIRDVHQFERDTSQLTVSSYSEYLPISTDESQLDSQRLIERFEQSDVISRLLESDNLKIVSERWTSTSAELILESATEQLVLFDWLYVEGWAAQIDGQPVNVFPSNPIGLVAVNVPQGEFNLTISLQPTQIQSVSVLMSLIGVLGILALSIIWKRFQGFSNLHNLQLDPEVNIYVVVVIIGISVFLFKAVILDWTDTAFKATRYGNLGPENYEIVPLANFGNQIDLLGTNIEIIEISDRLVEFKLYWRLHDEMISDDYSTIIRMRNPQGIVIAESGSFQPGRLATSNWLRETYIEDTIQLEIPLFTPPLDEDSPYTFEVSVFDPMTLDQLSVLNAVGNPIDVRVVLDDFYYHQYNSTTAAYRKQPIDVVQDNQYGVGLYAPTGVTGLPEKVQVGDAFAFSWTWQRVEYMALPEGNDMFAQLIGIQDDESVRIVSQQVPLVDRYPVQDWHSREVVTGHHLLFVPANLPAGDYEMGIQLLDKNGERLDDILLLNHRMQVTEPERTFEQPASKVEANDVWDNGLVLIGYDIGQDGQVSLVWQTNELQNDNLRLFVHIVEENDLIVAQSDGIPVDWTRPITSWIPEEYITTTHHFELPIGSYRVRIGWYDPISGDRILIENMDALVLDDSVNIE